MNQGPHDMYYQSHMSTGQAPPPQTVTSTYAHPHQQPQNPLLQPGPGQYAQPQYGNQYGYPNGLTPPAGPSAVSAPMAPGQPVLPLPGVSQPAMAPSFSPGFDTTGQIQPPGMKPRVTATLWEDEGSLCFQVEARGICVARREDNHMINGTKLLNVAGMTRGRRDGILKSEKVRHVVKIGPMHLKGVWIPFERALDFANKEKITELLYPLFVHNIGGLLCHPTNQPRASQVMAAAQQRKDVRLSQAPPLPSLQQHHPLALPGPQPPLPHPQPMGRPSLERAHTFPTPPASASSAMGSMGASDNYPWNQQGMPNGQQTGQISIDTSLSNNARSLPNTPATTPPGSSIHGMPNYPPVSQAYDNSRQMYQPSPAQPSPYSTSNSGAQERPVCTHSGYVKSEMGPPTTRGAGPNGEQVDAKAPNGMHHGQSEGAPTAGAEEEADHEHDGEYTHDSGAYDTNRGSYNYSAPPGNSLSNDHSHLSPELSNSPHQNGSGRATPRTAAAPQSYYTPQGYNTPPRVGQASSNVYSVMSNDRPPANGASANDVYSSQGDMAGSMQNGYAPQPNGTSSMKRGRDDDDDRSDMKRRKAMLDGGSMPSPTFNHNQMPQPVAAMATSRRR
ncbi:cell pattern formation-associated protein stuA [Achaetomium macrosporum]|uniref:Cell pattern formation-associated protein stuA n=1 Tax=Achaetomium macrosporum TaxID=79813 RepID=A0AAN7CIV5_9PEZI|nr:cell pattern formation-associated protein stuA [Achaetomium macrosporum]